MASILQSERRSSGSHYTPRSLTQSIVTETLRPVLQSMGANPTPEQILALKVCDPAMGSGAFLVEVCRQLGDELVKAWNVYQTCLDIDCEPIIYARRLIAERCLYGVDKNPMAVSLGKLALSLVTFADNYPLTFLDHCLKSGDSLVGLTQDQIKRFTWESDRTYDDPDLSLLSQQLTQSRSNRDEIHRLRDEDYQSKQQCYQSSEELLTDTRIKADLAIAAFFAAGKPKARKEKTDELFQKYFRWRQNPENNTEVMEISQGLRSQEKPVIPFNWELEFPEVFNRPNPGFDVIVGNPPFAGKNTTINANPEGYLDWLKVVHPESHGNSDLAAHFFRRAFTLLRKNGTFGLIATNTISQGDTRYTGLRYICENGGTIYNATKRLKWPGVAAVVVSIVHVIKGKYGRVNQQNLDGQPVNHISAFLFKAPGNNNPKTLLANAGKSFQGSIVLGMGFTFDDKNPDATPIDEMRRLIESNPKNQECIFPYIGGEEVNSSPTHSYHRYVINFGDMSEQDARNYPDLMAIVETKVKPEREKQNRDALRIKWWQYAGKRPGLNDAIAPLNRVLVTNAQASNHLLFIFYQTKVVFAHSLNVFPYETYSTFTVLQSHIHEIWTRFFGSSMKDDLRYNPSDCFETFPFPEKWEYDPNLESVGAEYYQYRAELMVRNNEGLTKTYNRFHDPNNFDPEIIKLRELHMAMDKAVIAAYGWFDIQPQYEFILDYDDEEDSSKRKKPWRYRYPDDLRDEVLARLIRLNEKRFQEQESKILDGQPVNHISAFLFKAPGNNNPKTLLANAGKSFQGSIILGMGFTFDDTNPNATPIAEMHRLIESNPKNQECIFPYIGGEEVNSSPTHAYHRYVINFGDMSEQEARGYPDLMAIVETKVKPDREKQNRYDLRVRWWQYWRKRPGLNDAIAPLDRVLATVCKANSYLSFTFLSFNCVYSDALAIFAYQTYSTFTVLQSHIHEIWGRFFCSSMGDGLRYTPSDCFETFPFPENWEHDPTLESVGAEYYQYRADLMVRNNEGLTKTYNRFHDPNNLESEIIKLRELHMAMDKAVIAAYGWTDINPRYEFILDYEDEDDYSNKRKKPWRYRYPDDLRDEILARLIRLNSDRANQEKCGKQLSLF